MTLPGPAFQVGLFVRRRSAPESAGIVQRVSYSEARETWTYTVLFGNRAVAVPESDLELPTTASQYDDLAAGRLASLDALRAAFTYHRLRRPPARVAASFGSSRTLFFPYQFKPLLKLLEHPRRRVLVADDVGLGKTIEAGYILRELDANESLERVLVVCPARLVQKWRADLADKFQEHFEAVSTKQLMGLRQAQLRGADLPRFRWITSYEAARRPDFVEFMEQQPPQLDLVVMDEAHRARNPETLQHRLAAALCEATEAAVFLTATPVQTREEDLFHLLSLLDPDTYTSSYGFSLQMQANRHIARALTLLRASPPDGDAAAIELSALDRYPHAQHLVRLPLFTAVREQVRRAAQLGRHELVAVQRDLSEFGLTANILSRTRRVDVKEDRAKRRVQAISVSMSPAEQAYYTRIEDLCEQAGIDSGDWGTSFAAITAYRMAASCLPASVGYFAEKLGDPDLGDELSDGLLDEMAEVSPISPAADGATRSAPEFRQGLTRLARSTDLRHGDSKYRCLAEALREIWQDDAAAPRAKRKVIVFSFFKRTLGHLRACLQADGVICELISGDVAIAEREDRIAHFREDPRVDVLLASEVGAEGIDLQFASVVVNYDLPWNPMVVEQRIGRVDRIGQLSPTITIINLTLKGTIDERILMRLYHRVQLFEGMVGEIEPIVGEQVFQLARQALIARLTPDEEERQVEQTANAFVNQLLHATELNRNVDAMLATDQAFLDEVEASVGRRRLPTPSEMRDFLQAALTRRFHGCDIPVQAATGITRPQLNREVAQALRQMPTNDRGEADRVARLIERDGLEMTFAADKALTMRRVELVHARHPLVVLAQSIFAEALGGELTCFAVAAKRPLLAEEPACSELPAGYYILALSMLEFNGAIRRNDLSIIAMPVNGPDSSAVRGDAARELLIWLLDQGRELTALIPSEVLNEAAETSTLLYTLQDFENDCEYRREERVNTIRAERKTATLRAALDLQVQHATEQRDRALQRERGAFYARMCEAKLSKALKRRELELAALAPSRELKMESENLALILVRLTED